MRAVQYHPTYCPEAMSDKSGDFDTSHDLSLISDDGRILRKIAVVKHAEWAEKIGELIVNHTKESDWFV